MEAHGEISFLAMLLPLAGIVFIIAVGVVLLNQQFQKNLYRQKLEQEELKNLHQQQLLISSIQAQEEERKRIAQDLHDEMGAALSITRMHVIQLERKKLPPGHEDFSATLFDIRNLLDNSLANMRRISHQLMPPQLESFGLVKTLESVAAQISKTGEISIELAASPALPAMSWPVSLGLYRILMELISNTIRHAGASGILIDLQYINGELSCRYTDNGCGLPPEAAGSGLGHKGLEGRVASLGGSLGMGNRNEGGYYALITIPLSDAI